MGALKPGLYAITDEQLTPAAELLPAVEAALRGGAVLVQYRNKTGSQAERLRQATDLASLCRQANVPLLINDDPPLAKRVQADGVHLGQEDCTLTEARVLLGSEAIIGMTCHHRLDLARNARDSGADYLAFGRFYSSSTKPGAPPADASVLTEAKTLGLPLTAIGGITVDNGRPLIEAGADLLAVVGGLFGGTPEQIEHRARAFARLFASHHPLFSLSD
ncbi:thiamine phosphate synthase [Marinobacter persicus]|uniref:Thiamine-phosphate synthase n=1 Tax=Marinobacter persicus TaxID=930118 RepID=A0A2S6G5X8_9GAMM|nr:thiamine phosphate synthase [Marinobacter persicus]KXS49803.1 MAG: Thiamine-phosphate synthase [Marinobacter sp. T13-3]PPK51271.1 thiamine-phosphate diphosphorylase [Marinobacter persicus]PPK54540.1 thiamine-phosphate diphosphorylase [Marinobacter persicus]PPK57866.1 thiamine-phosphate diphosphorylase [Marinobacter persicus]